jgi:hypothetical protein
MVGGGGGASSGAIAGENSGVSGMYVYVKTFEHDGALCRERSSVEQRKGDAGEEVGIGAVGEMLKEWFSDKSEAKFRWLWWAALLGG